MDGVRIIIDTEELDPRTKTVYEEVVAALGGDEDTVHTVVEQSAEEAVESSLNALYERREEQLGALVDQMVE
jgi:hypothetical protein